MDTFEKLFHATGADEFLKSLGLEVEPKHAVFIFISCVVCFSVAFFASGILFPEPRESSSKATGKTSGITPTSDSSLSASTSKSDSKQPPQ